MLVPDDRFSQVAGIAGMRADQAVPAKDYASSEGMIEINLIALKNGSTRRKQVIQVDIPPLATWGPCACGRANWFFRPVGASRTHQEDSIIAHMSGEHPSLGNIAEMDAPPEIGPLRQAT
jgi:hypothetical protein